MDRDLQRIPGVAAAVIRKGIVYIEYRGRVKPVHVGPHRQCSYMLLSMLFEPWLDPMSITVNGQRLPVEDPEPDAASGFFTIMSAQEYEELRYRTKYDPLHIDGIPEYTPGHYSLLRSFDDLLSQLGVSHGWKVRLGLHAPRQLHFEIPHEVSAVYAH